MFGLNRKKRIKRRVYRSDSFATYVKGWHIDLIRPSQRRATFMALFNARPRS